MKTLTYKEYTVLNKISKRTKMDCWFLIKQNIFGRDYVYDLENRKRLRLRKGISMLMEGLDCQENYDNCLLERNEKEALKALLEKLNITLDVDWKI